MDCIHKIVVFDLDETLGYFVELGMFWDSLKQYFKYINNPYQLKQEDFNLLLDLFPEFQRPNIFKILHYLKKKKQLDKCDRIMIYTNNQGHKSWAEYIKTYYELKLKYNLFDQIIAAFKVNGKIVEICRSTHSKTYTDLIKCSKIPENTQICFLDDVFYPEMSNENVYYINIKPYIHHIPFETMLDRFCESGLLRLEIKDTKVFKEYVLNMLNSFYYDETNKTSQELSIDKILTKKILQHLETFFNAAPNKNYTRRRNKINPKNITRKNK